MGCSCSVDLMALAKTALRVASYLVLAALAAMWLMMLVGSAWTMIEAVVVGEGNDLAVAAFVILVERDWMPNVRHFLPVQILLPLVVLAAASGHRAMVATAPMAE